jgi:Mce-associated membrane protein
VEDQPAEPGDLTTDAPEAPEEATEKAPDTAAANGPATDADAVPVETTAADRAGTTPRRGRWYSWRRAKPVGPQPAPASDETDSAATETESPEDATAARPTPVGKAGRVKSVAAPGAESPEPAPVLVPHQPAGKRLKIAAAAAGVLFIGAGAFAGATLQPYLADRALVDTKLEVAETAANAITTLWTYTPNDMETLPNRSAKYLAGDFATEYRRYIDAIVAPNKQAKVTNKTQVLGTAVESLTPTEATAIVYTNSVATSPVTKDVPSLRYLSYRLTMEHRDTRWLITRMTAITQLDLTPRL